MPRDYTLLLTMADRQANDLVRARKRDQKDKDANDGAIGGDKEGSRNNGTGRPAVAPATNSKASAYRTSTYRDLLP